MAAFRTSFNRLLFVAYVVAFISIPFAMLLGLPGAAAGVASAALFLVALRYHGTQRVAKQLAVAMLPTTEAPHWAGINREYCRRLGIAVPRLGVMETDSVNIASFGFAPADGWVVITRGALQRLSRIEISALIARQLVLWKRSEVAGHTWLALFLNALDIWVEPKRDKVRAKMRHSHPVRLFLRQVLFYPLTLIPCSLLRGQTRESNLDHQTALLCGSHRALAEALRKIEAYSERQPLRVPVSFQHLFLKSPHSADPLARLFFSTSSLADRIRFLEQMPVLENA
jgi:heat shock protein HtpX